MKLEDMAREWVAEHGTDPSRHQTSSLADLLARVRDEALEEAAEAEEAECARRDTNDGVTYCINCGAPQGNPWPHDDGCVVARLRAMKGGGK